MSSEATSKLFKLKDDRFIEAIVTQLDPEIWKIKSKNEERGENLLHHFINEGHRLSAIALLTTDHPHVTDLVFEKNKAGNTPLMSSLKQRRENVSHKIWEVMLSRGQEKIQEKIEEIGSQLSQILQLCAQNDENDLLLKILEDIHTKNPPKVCELVFERTAEERTVLDTCKDEATLMKILKLLEIKTVKEDDLLRLDRKDENVLNHWARRDFHESIDHLQNHLCAETFKKMILQKSSGGKNPIMMSALHGNRDCLDIFLHHICLYQKTLYKDDLGGILHDEDKHGDTLLALVLQQPGRLDAAKNMLLYLEMKYHGASEENETAEKGKKELTECMKKHLKPSVEVQRALNDIDSALPKSFLKKAGIWVRVFLKSFLLPVLLLCADVFFDAVLVDKYSDHEDSDYDEQYQFCRFGLGNETGMGIDQDITCVKNLSSTMPFVCIPFALEKYPRFNYSLAFVISPWIFYYIEYCQSDYWQNSTKVRQPIS